MASRLPLEPAEDRDRRPLIGVTGPARRGNSAWWFTRYALRRAGARALRITPQRAIGAARLDGLVIGGGDDIDPRRYGATAARIAIKIDPARDELEWRMLELATAQALPVLGICRGAQLINVFHGGTLHQDITAAFENIVLRRTVLPRKSITISNGTRLQSVMQTLRTEVNSLHRQSVNRLASGFRIAACDTDGIVQAIEASDERWLLGVQWHPEYLPQRQNQRRIFRALVGAAGQRLGIGAGA